MNWSHRAGFKLTSRLEPDASQGQDCLTRWRLFRSIFNMGRTVPSPSCDNQKMCLSILSQTLTHTHVQNHGLEGIKDGSEGRFLPCCLLSVLRSLGLTVTSDPGECVHTHVCLSEHSGLWGSGTCISTELTGDAAGAGSNLESPGQGFAGSGGIFIPFSATVICCDKTSGPGHSHKKGCFGG